ncbi:MAG: bifunctional nuclease family protein [Patescibacteria group bacterium]
MTEQSDEKVTNSGNHIPCKILGLFVHPTRNTPVVFIGTEDERVVIPIWIGFLEAQAILFAWKHITPPRPLTSDLLVSVIREDFGAAVEEVSIHTLQDGTYYASLALVPRRGERILRDARPSDALAVALRTHAALTISKELVDATVREQENAKALLDFLRLEQEDLDNTLQEESSTS